MLLLEVLTAEGASGKEGCLHVLVVGVFSVAVAMVLVVDTVAGLVKVCVEIVKP